VTEDSVIWHSAVAIALLPAAHASDTVRVCLAPASVQMVAGSTDAAMEAVRGTFASFLTGPSLAVQPLTARLASQAREEAKAAACQYVLFTTFKHERKGGHAVLGRAASGAVESGAWNVLVRTSSTQTKAAAGAAMSAAAATREVAGSLRARDELTLGWRLEAGDGRVLLDKSEKRKASNDGEDVLTPLVERASESVVTTVKAGK
jgi:hypothetical protein